MDRTLVAQVRQRARDICEYCRMPQKHDMLTFEVESTPGRFDERGVETEQGGLLGHRQPKGPATRKAAPTPPRHSSTLLPLRRRSAATRRPDGGGGAGAILLLNGIPAFAILFRKGAEFSGRKAEQPVSGMAAGSRAEPS
jgi:hypothetical protein